MNNYAHDRYTWGVPKRLIGTPKVYRLAVHIFGIGTQLVHYCYTTGTLQKTVAGTTGTLSPPSIGGESSVPMQSVPVF